MKTLKALKFYCTYFHSFYPLSSIQTSEPFQYPGDTEQRNGISVLSVFPVLASVHLGSIQAYP